MNDDDVAVSCLSLRQGDLFNMQHLMIDGAEVEARFGVVVVSQTCDLVRLERHPNAVVALAVELDEDSARDAQRGRTARWVPVPGSKPQLFADLNFIGSVPKRAIAELAIKHSIPDADWDNQRDFAQRVGRWFSRLALPDSIVPWLAPMQRLVQDRANKSGSPIGRVLDLVVQFRIHSKLWAEPYDLTIYLVLKPGELPLPGEDPFLPLTPGIMSNLGDVPSVAEVSEFLFPATGERPTGSDRQALWQELGAALQRLVFVPPKDASPDVRRAVVGITIEIVGEDEFTLMQARRSGELDFAHLSGPTLD